MRELKFRIWDGERFLHSSFGKKDAEFISLKIEGGILPQYGGLINYHKTMVVQQYTGLKDKNGTEIYEGDILKYEFLRATIYYEVFWDEVNGAWKNTKKNGGNVGSWFDLYEVAGNIFENSELLKQ